MIDFPASPTVGQVFTSAGMSWRWTGTYWAANTAAGGSINIGDTPPAGAPGMTWWDSTDGQLYLWYDDPSADPGQWVPATNLGSTAVTNTGNVGRNLIHNPMFNIRQRGTGPWTATSYTVDRWFAIATLDTVSWQIFAMPDADRAIIGDEAAAAYLQNVFAGNVGAGAFNMLSQRIEDVRRLAGKTVTASFWAKAASGAPKLGISISQSFGTGGSPSPGVDMAAGNAVTLSTTWTRYASTIAIPSVVGKTLGTNNDSLTELRLWFSSGATANAQAGSIGVQSGTIILWGVQLEIGSVATPLEKPDPRYDLANCQRFYQVANISMRWPASGATQPFAAPGTYMPMRAVPTAVVGSGSPGNLAGAPVFYPTTTQGGRLEAYSTAAGDAYALNYPVTLSADL